ncbi:MAG: hypothetical protein RLZZ401_1814, partial [Pseudomonadota bacterium]
MSFIYMFRLFFASLLIAISGASFATLAQIGQRDLVTTEQIRAELIAHAPQGVSIGRPVWVGLRIAHQPEWHTYWKNPGDSGLPTVLEFKLPTGVSAGEIAWPTPHKIRIGTLVNYGYEGAIMLAVPLTIGPDFKPEVLSTALDVGLKASWLVCRKECIPQEGDFSLKIPLKSSTAFHAVDFETGLSTLPAVLTGESQAEVEARTLKVSVNGLPAGLRNKTLEFFAEVSEVVENAAPWTQMWNGDVWTARVPLAAQRSQSPTILPFVLAFQGQGYRTEAHVLGQWPAATVVADVSPALSSALQANANTLPEKPALGLMMALLGALLGGLILNLMPCVFPILAIKVLAFTRHAGSRCAHRVDGVAYTIGVVTSFLALGMVMLALRSAGEQLGWGFQLQLPAVIAGLAVLFTIVGLNMVGLFEFGNMLPNRLATIESKHPAVNAFLSGVLAVAIASPCTAPFMGASLGLAVTLPAAEALLVFAGIGIGMATPYLMASLLPGLANWLPRPGPWMDVFRKLMAFPLFATVVWLVWVLGQQSGIDGAGALLAILVVLAAVLWATSLAAGTTRRIVTATTVSCLVLSLWAFGAQVVTPIEAARVTGAPAEWQAWEPGKVEQLMAAGQPVFLDFTAAWC